MAAVEEANREGGSTAARSGVGIHNVRMDGRSEDTSSVPDLGQKDESVSPEDWRDGVEDMDMQDGNTGQEVSSTIEELVAKARAPVKKEFLTTAGVRVVNSHGTVTGGSDCSRPSISKRQLKKNRQELQSVKALGATGKVESGAYIGIHNYDSLSFVYEGARKSTTNICAVVAKTRDPSKCPYGDKCRFNHNVEVYMAQKPPDLPGKCPSLESGEPCSYSITCRFAGTHQDFDELERSKKKPSNTPRNERNILRKDYQKLLWKNKGHYPKADAQLRAMGLLAKAYKLNSVEAQEEKGPDVENTIPVTMDVEANGTSESLEDTKRGEGEDIKMPTSAALQVDVSEPVPSGNMTSSHPSKRPKTTTDGSASEDRKSSPVQHGSSTGVDILSSPEDLSSTAMDISGAAAAELKLEDSASDQLIEEKGDSKSSADKDNWRTLYFEAKLSRREKKLVDFRDKLYLAPLTTVGNLPFRRVCKTLGADITCGEMAMCRNLLQGAASEWALLRRHSSEDIFGVQICGGFPDHVARTAEMIERECDVDFIDVNIGCPIDLVVNSGAGSCLLTKPQRLEQIVRATAGVMENPLTLKLRMGYYEGRNCTHTFMPDLHDWGVSAVTVHGRTRQQRYSKGANWDYILECSKAAPENLQVIGNGDIMAYTDWHEHLRTSGSKLTTCMIARGALMKPWLFTEIKELRHWDISSGERLEILRQYVNAGLAHWGSDAKGVEVTRKFLLEWLSYTHRYIPVGLLEVVPQRLNWRPPSYFGRNDLETLMASESAADWIKISEILLGPVPPSFIFHPKHKSNAYDRAENG